MMEQYLHGKLSPASEAQAAEMQKRRIGYGARFVEQKSAKEKAKEAKEKAAKEKAAQAKAAEAAKKEQMAKEAAKAKDIVVAIRVAGTTHANPAKDQQGQV
jgi:membrane protein involved in colicin uptake